MTSSSDVAIAEIEAKRKLWECLVTTGSITVNELRAFAGLPPVEWGDNEFVEPAQRVPVQSSQEGELFSGEIKVMEYIAPYPGGGEFVHKVYEVKQGKIVREVK